MTLHGWKFRKMEVGEDDRGHVETLDKVLHGSLSTFDYLLIATLS